MPGFDLKQINRNDQGILGAGILFFLLSFFVPFYGVSGHGFGGGYSYTVNAWHSYGVLGDLLIIIAVALVAARVFANFALPKLPVGPNVLITGLATLGTLLLLLRGFTYKTASGGGYSLGLKWGAYLIFILAIVVVVFAFLNLKASGEKVAWDSTAVPRGAAATPPATPYPPQGAAPTYPPAPAPTYPPAEPSTGYPPADPGAPAV
jgi:hypothetical protein